MEARSQAWIKSFEIVNLRCHTDGRSFICWEFCSTSGIMPLCICCDVVMQMMYPTTFTALGMMTPAKVSSNALVAR